MHRFVAVITLCALVRVGAAAELPPPPGVDAFVGCKKYPADKKFKWTVRGEVGVTELAASLGEISCKPILVGSAVAQRGGKVVLEVPDLVTATDVYRLFYGALEAMGYTVDTAGGAIKIVDSGRAKEVAAPQLDGAVPADDRFIVRLLHPKHAAPTELAELLGKLKSKEGDVSVFGAASLVIIDRAGNVRRMEEVARALDVGESGARVFTLTTHGQTPTDLAGSIEKILGAASRRVSAPAAAPDKSGKPTGAAIDADVRALVPLDQAHLIAVIGSDAGFARVRAVAERLDPPADDGAAAQGHVIYLANTNAEDLATTLGSIGLGGRSTGSTRPSGSTSSTPSAAVASSASALPLTGEVRVGADKTANALVVFANASDFAMVRDLVQKLDIPRRQVYVEAVILDLSIDKMREIGVSWHQIGNAAGNAAFASSASSSLASVNTEQIAQVASSAGLTTGILGSSIGIFGKSVPGLGVVLHALEQSKDANVISRPHLLTMDNVKATLSVGQQVYYPSQSITSTLAPTTLSNSYAARDIALKLELTPHLNDSPSIRLEINGEISDIPEGATDTGGGPTTNKRTVQTAVVVCDGQSVVLGGLTKETDSVAVDKVPFLGDIPLLGRLFQTRSKKRVKQDLLIVLTPYIVRGPDDLRRIQERKDAEHREFLERSTAFSDQNFEAHVDYRRKRGVLEEINVTAIAAAHDAEAFHAAERQLKPLRGDGPIALEPVMETSNR